MKAALLAIVIGGMGIGVPAASAQDVPQISFHLDVRFADTATIHDVKCDEKVKIAANAAAVIKFRGVVIPEYVPGSWVIGSEPNRGTLAPSRAPVQQFPIIGTGRYASAAAFTYTAKENGTESLTFKFEGPNGQPLATQTIQFEVTDCKIRSTLIYDTVWPVGGETVIYGTGIMEDVEITADESGKLHGEGQWVYNQIMTGFVCSVTWTTLTSDVTISGDIREDQIDLDFAFGDSSVTGEGVCPDGSASFATTGNPSKLFRSHEVFPLVGGVTVYRSPSAPPDATVTVIVTREEEEGAVSLRGSGDVLAVLGNP